MTASSSTGLAIQQFRLVTVLLGMCEMTSDIRGPTSQIARNPT